MIAEKIEKEEAIVPRKEGGSSRRAPLICLVLLFCVAAILRSFAPSPTTQLLVFPLALLLTAFTLRTFLAPALLLLLFAGTTLHTRGMLSDTFYRASGYVSLSHGDVAMRGTRPLFAGANEVAALYGLPKFGFLPREFSASEASSWLAAREKVRVLVSGVRKNIVLYFSPEQPTPSLPTELLSRYGIAPSGRIRLQSIPGTPLSLVVLSAPRLVTLPLDPLEGTRHFVAFLLAALTANEGERFSLFQLTASLEGPWRTSTPLALGRFFLGTAELLSGSDVGTIRCAKEMLREASEHGRPREQPELVGAIFNNAAVAGFLSREREFRKSERWLRLASRIRLRDGSPPESARVAALNLYLLEKDPPW